MQETLADVYQRGNSYKFLSECYYLPDENLLEKVGDAAGSNSFFVELACLVPGVTELDSLRVDFTRLFVGPFKLLAPPYGSVYLEDNRILGDSTVDVRSFYEGEGLEVVIKDAPDHIAMELEFMHYLVTKQIEATGKANLQILESFLQKQQSFLQTHLTRWLPRFVQKVQENAQTEFYRKLTQLTGMFVQKDMNDCSLCYAQQSGPIGEQL
ncbi:MAG: TorD/DmsD family molecular chaperone [Planctomycetota bacterium]|jgi:TorA maturation chaperone TorD